MTTYERIRVAGKTIYLRDAAETTLLGSSCLTGIEVDREGDEVAPEGVDERYRIIELALISKRTPVVMDRKYGTLTDVGAGTIA